MKLSNPVFLCLPLLIVTLTGAPTAFAQLPGSTTLELGYGSGTCQFVTNSGVSISGTQPGVLTADGVFGAGCPTGGGNTGPVALTLSATPATAEVNDTAIVSWSATADICRYNPQTALPAPLSNWPAQGDACVGAQACSQAHSALVALATGGTYTFGLTCTSGATQSHAEQTVSKTAKVVVTGSTPPPPSVCQSGPTGLTQQLSGKMSDDTGLGYVLSDGPQTTWSEVFGVAWSTGLHYYAWPGLLANTTKLTISKNSYVSLKFTVPSGYPLSNLSEDNTYTNSGGFRTNASATTSGVQWAVSITPDCANFNRPAYGDPQYRCYAQYAVEQGTAFYWVVTSPGAPLQGVCNLNPGSSYFLNIIAAPLNHPTQSNCDGSSCKVNFQQAGSFTSGSLIP